MTYELTMRWQRAACVLLGNNTRCNINVSFVLGVLLAVVIGVGLGLLIGALLFTVLLLKNKYVMPLDILL